jgi:hypothetical protein
VSPRAQADVTPPAPRRIACARCGAEFACNLNGDCWCTAEPYRLPVPDRDAEDCLCPQCLRQRAGERG